MSVVDELGKLFLYWMSGYSEAPIYLVLAPDPQDEYHQWILRDCYVSGVEVPDDEQCSNALQSLLDDGFALASFYDNHGNLKPIERLKDRVDPDMVVFELTERGEDEALEFRDFLRSETGRLRSVEFTREQLAEHAGDMSFSITVPDYLPPTFDPFAIVNRYPDDNGVTLRYYEWGDDQLFIDETTLELGADEGEGQPTTEKQEHILGMDVVVRERTLGPAWFELSLEWRQGFVSYRVSYHRTSGQPDGDENGAAADEPFSDEPVVVDDEMRSDARRVAESIIRLAP